MTMPSTASTRRRRSLRLTGLAAVLATGALLAGNTTTAEAVPPEVTSRWNNELVHSGSVSPGFSTFLSSGAYTITAKLFAENTGSAAIAYSCTISAAGGADTDLTEVTLPPGGKQPIFLNVVHNFTGTGQLTFACFKPAGTAQVRMKQIKITAVKVNALDNQQF
jgi:hypothetical protein